MAKITLEAHPAGMKIEKEYGSFDVNIEDGTIN